MAMSDLKLNKLRLDTAGCMRAIKDILNIQLDKLSVSLIRIVSSEIQSNGNGSSRMKSRAIWNVKETTIFGCIIIGAILGFLLFNMHPAHVFMGDTGSLLLGGAIAGIALYLKLPLLLLIIAIVPIIETLSVIIQVTYYKKTKKRFFKMAPIHHHFELSGWNENKIVSIFSLVTAIASVIGILAI